MKGVMKMKKSKMFIPVVFLLVCISNIYAQDWPQYLGPVGYVSPTIVKVGGSTQNWAPMALANGKLLIRDQSRLICVKVAQ